MNVFFEYALLGGLYYKVHHTGFIEQILESPHHDDVYDKNTLDDANINFRIIKSLRANDDNCWWYDLYQGTLKTPNANHIINLSPEKIKLTPIKTLNSTLVETPNSKIIHLRFIDEIDADSVKIKYPGIEHVEVTVNKLFDFKILNSKIQKGQRTLIYSFSRKPNNKFIRKYNTYLANPSNYNKNLSIIHSTVFDNAFIKYSEEYEQVLNVYFKNTYPRYNDHVNNKGVIKEIVDSDDIRGHFDANILQEDHKFRIIQSLPVNDHQWWYDLFLTHSCSKGRLLQLSGTCAITSALNLMFLTPYIASAASVYLQELYDRGELKVISFEDMRNSTDDCISLCRSFIFNILVKKLKVKFDDGDITLLLSARLKGISQEDDENFYKSCGNYNERKKCNNTKKEDECKDTSKLSRADKEQCYNAKMGYSYGQGVSAAHIVFHLVTYILDEKDYWESGRRYENQKIKILEPRERDIANLQHFVLTSCLLYIYFTQNGLNIMHSSCGFTCNGISYVCDSNCDVFKFDWKTEELDWNKYATLSKYLLGAKVDGEIRVYFYQREA